MGQNSHDGLDHDSNIPDCIAEKHDGSAEVLIPPEDHHLVHVKESPKGQRPIMKKSTNNRNRKERLESRRRLKGLPTCVENNQGATDLEQSRY